MKLEPMGVMAYIIDAEYYLINGYEHKVLGCEKCGGYATGFYPNELNGLAPPCVCKRSSFDSLYYCGTPRARMVMFTATPYQYLVATEGVC